MYDNSVQWMIIGDLRPTCMYLTESRCQSGQSYDEVMCDLTLHMVKLLSS